MVPIAFILLKYYNNHYAGDDPLEPGLLNYLIEGVLPLLHSFYSVFFKPADVPHEEQRDMEYKISAQIAKNMIVSQI